MKIKYCKKCVKAFPGNNIYCPICGVKLVLADDTPENDEGIETLKPERHYNYAAPWRRVCAIIIDWGILYSFAYMLVYPLGHVLRYLRLINIIQFIIAQDAWISMLIAWAYFVILTKLFNATIGKQIMNIFVLSSRGAPLTWWQVILRETIGRILSIVVFGWGYISIVFNSKKQGWHDRLAGTYVMERKAKKEIGKQGKSNEYELTRCPRCKSKFGVNKAEGVIKVKCPSCKYKYDYKCKRESVFEKIISYYGAGGEKEGAKWYHRAWFVFVVLFLYYPAGVIALWASPLFKRYIKVILTIFGAIFLLVNAQSPKDIATQPTATNIFEYWQLKNAEIFVPRIKHDKIIEIPERRVRRKMSVSAIFKELNPTIVLIESFDSKNKGLGLGSGFIISSDGNIATNYHVVAGAAHIRITMYNGDKYSDVKLVAQPVVKYLESIFNTFDLAILDIPANNLPHVYFGDADKINEGDDVVAIGNPLGYQRTVSNGIISAIREGEKGKLLQHNAAMSGGSSGGPLVNIYGEVIGVNAMSEDKAQNMNFAIPINYLVSFIYIVNNPERTNELLNMLDELNQSKAELNVMHAEMTSMEAKLDKLKNKADEAVANGNYALYSSIKDEYNQIVAKYNDTLDTFKRKNTIYKEKKNYYDKEANKLGKLKH
jgi:S1-C subfamily serine protease/uncharacterized RDD family membrane protein YckC